MGSLRHAWHVLVQGRTGADAAFYFWGLLNRLTIAAIVFMAVIAVLLALEPTP